MSLTKRILSAAVVLVTAGSIASPSTAATTTPDRSLLIELETTVGPIAELSTSADGSLAVFTSAAVDLTDHADNGFVDVFLLNRNEGVVLNLTPSGNGASSHPEISADGSTVVFQSDATNLYGLDTNGVTDVFEWRVSSGRVRSLTKNSSKPSWSPHVSGDGSVIGFTSGTPGLSNRPGEAQIPMIRKGTTTRRLAREVDGSVELLDVSSDGTYALLASGDLQLAAVERSQFDHTDLLRWNLETGERDVVHTAEFIGFLAGAHVSSDGSIVAYSTGVGSRPFQATTVWAERGSRVTFGDSAFLRDLSGDGSSVLIDSPLTSLNPTVWNWRDSTVATVGKVDLDGGGALDWDGSTALLGSGGRLLAWELPAPVHPTITDLTVSNIHGHGGTVSFATDVCSGARYTITAGNGRWTSTWSDGYPDEDECWTSHYAVFGRQPFSVPLYSGVTYHVAIEVVDAEGRLTNAETSFTTN